MAKELKVKVISKAGDKTVVGLYFWMQKHPLYGKYVKKRKKYMIHDESNKIAVGEEIFIKESRPISKKKSWIAVKQSV
ncbi:MAG: 30S ribosomal protein S17 [Rickettsiales bacterium]|jgi:small subunit ribosomal protein S17|nr:30S ribosomal protein S17 [Rickettsiales bacterium]